MVLMLLFPEYEIAFTRKAIILKKENEESSLNSNNFEEFQDILKQMFSFGDTNGVPQDFNPDGPMAARIAEKLKNDIKSLQKKIPMIILISLVDMFRLFQLDYLLI